MSKVRFSGSALIKKGVISKEESFPNQFHLLYPKANKEEVHILKQTLMTALRV